MCDTVNGLHEPHDASLELIHLSTLPPVKTRARMRPPRPPDRAFCAGHRVFVCDNLAFRSEITVARKHTRFGETRFGEAICRAVGALTQFREAEANRIRQFQEKALPDEWASHLVLGAYERGLVSHYSLPAVLKEWREPSFEEFRPRTLWSLLNAFTTALRPRQKTNPQQFASLTIRLQDMLATSALGQPASEPLHATSA